MSAASPSVLRNVCIIAHIDHGKTTLANQLLRQSRWFDPGGGASAGGAAGAQHAQRAGGEEGAEDQASLDSGELERERGITILSKVTSFAYKVTRRRGKQHHAGADAGAERGPRSVPCCAAMGKGAAPMGATGRGGGEAGRAG